MKKLLLSLALTASSVLCGFAETTYELTPITDLKTGDKVVIVDQTSARAMTNNNGTSSPAASSVTLSSDKQSLTATDYTTILFTITVDNGKYTFTSANPNASGMLYCTATNAGVKVGTGSNNVFSWDATNKRLKNDGQNRWLGVYSNKDWRCYNSATATNIKETVTAFYKETVVVDENQVATPVADVASGTYFGAFNLTLSCATEGATISYTIGEETKTYTEPIAVTETCQIKVSATKDGMTASEEIVLDYVIEAPLTGKGTEADPYTATDALRLIAAGHTEEVYVKGIVTAVTEISTEYGNATYNISDNGENENVLLIFRGYSLNGDKFTSADEIQAGDKVVVKGSLINYNNDTPEIAQGNILISLERAGVAKDPKLAFSVEELRVALNHEDYSAPVLTAAEGFDLSLVKWTSSDENVAYQEGEDLLVDSSKVGTATITASFAGNEEWSASTASYTVTVYELIAEKPTFSIENGATVYPGTVLTISCATEGATINYTVNNGDIVSATAPVNITFDELGQQTITAYASLNGYTDSEIAELAFEVVEQPAVSSNVYEKVTDNSQIVAGAKYIIVSAPTKSGTVQYGPYALSTAKATNKGFDGIELDESATTMEVTYEITNENISIFTLEPTTDGKWYVKSGNQYLDGTTVKALKYSDTANTTFEFDATAAGTTTTIGTNTKLQIVATNASKGVKGSVTFNNYDKDQNTTVYLYKQAGPVAPAVPVLEVDGVAVEDLTKEISLNKEIKTVRIIAADGHHVYHKHVLEADEEDPRAINALAAEADDFTHVEDNVAEVRIERNGTLHFYAAHPTTGAQSDVASVRFINDHTTEIAEIDATNGAAQWFDLQGRRVSAPANGVFIKVAAGKAVKVAL